MMIPVVVFFVVFSYIPMYGIVLAFKDFRPSRGILGSEWVGWEHIEFMFTAMPEFMRAVKNTIVISLLKLLFCFPAPIILALFLNEIGSKSYKKTIQTAVYFPNFISWVIFGTIVYQVFGIDGLINNVRIAMGLDPVSYMHDSSNFYPILIAVTIIKEAGWGTIIYMSSISAISPELYEAAKVDGAGRFRSMWYITLPSILPVITIMLLLQIGNIMNVGFDPIFNLYNRSIYDVADVIDTYVYRIGLSEGNFEIGTAVGLFKTIINFMLIVGANFIAKRINGYGLYASAED